MKCLAAIFVFAVFAATAFAQTTANSKPAETQPEKPREKVVLGFIGKSNSSPIFRIAQQGADETARAMEKNYNRTLVIDNRTPLEYDPIKQAQAIEDLVKKGAGGIMISCTEPQMLTAAIDRAVDAGIPVYCFGTDAPKSKRIAYYGINDEVVGSRIAEILLKKIGNKGTVAILAGNQNAPNLQLRMKGLQKTLAEHKEVKLLDPVYHVETPHSAVEKMEAFQQANPQITGWALLGGWPLFDKDGLKWKPDDVKVVAMDALPQELVHIQSGAVETLLAQDCYGWGAKGVEILLEKIVNKKDPKEAVIADQLIEINKKNEETYRKTWEKAAAEK